MQKIIYILFIFPVLVFGQIEPVVQDSTAVEYYIIDGDSVAVDVIQLREVYLMGKQRFATKEERIRYLILKRKTLKVYPYAKLAADRLVELNRRLETLEKKSEKRQYTRIIQRYIEEEFTDELKKLTRTEGQILVKLMHRQTGETTFELIKDLKSGWKAFWMNSTAKLFDISLKKEFDPENVAEDFMIEDILLRAFQEGRLERQNPAFPIDYYAIKDKWAAKVDKN
ncbi:DUF4294 domain-containing protein [Subsaxibacter sp. CAU 1640]|uniref:DUF4294 domain-containing protein n=1 Tax=Subsaxibacter sp. CAU 1640 TaxID=2933271 RepID=UPI002002D554|nr:DUF4294 domain-containing protein [Subsaxibacter sp. CAU 1640]MCK7591157.1 DUF4294 domain-containing protein [Subsaxibacter sp. CAU 1640]